MKKIIVIFIIIITIFIIYLSTRDQKVYYLALGDDITTIGIDEEEGFSNHINRYLEYYDKSEQYINEFSQKNYRITDLTVDILDNRKEKVSDSEKTIKNALIKADLVTLSIGMNDITSKVSTQTIDATSNYQFLYGDVDEIVNDLEMLFVELKKLCKEDIYLIGIYYPYKIQNQSLNSAFSYMNKKFKEKADEYQIHYIDIFDIFTENESYISQTTIYPSKEGLEAIGSQVIVTINNAALKSS